MFGTSIRWIPALFLAGALAHGGVLEDGHDPSIRGTFQDQAIPGPEDRAPVLDMVLDPEGNVLVAYHGDRGIWRIDLAGAVSLHALIPDGGGDILSMTLDPAGDLHVRDGSALWKVTADGEVSLAKEGETAAPCAEAPAERKPADSVMGTRMLHFAQDAPVLARGRRFTNPWRPGRR